MFGWNERPTKAKVRHRIGGQQPAVIYEIGRYLVSVPYSLEDDLAVTYTAPNDHRASEPRQTFPNMEVRDGELRLPLVDIVDQVLARVEPVEIAQALWTNEDVRTEFMYCLKTRFTEMGIDDTDRRKFLAEVKEAVHSKALDRLAGKMSALEHEINRATNYYAEIRSINETLRDNDVQVSRPVRGENGEWTSQMVVLQFDERQHKMGENGRFVTGDLAVGGMGWEQAREFWRQEVLKQFPMPDLVAAAADVIAAFDPEAMNPEQYLAWSLLKTNVEAQS